MNRAALTLAAALTGATTAGAAAAELRVGISSDNPPWSFVPERVPALLAVASPMPAVTPAQFKTLTGLDVDIANALGRQMGTAVRFVPANWGSIEKELVDNSFDAILSSWTPSRHTPAAVVASDPYLSWGLVICVRSGDAHVKSYADLAQAKLVGHYSDPAVEQTLRSMGAIRMKSYDNEAILFRDLKSGAIDVLVHDSTYVRWRTNLDPGFSVVGEPLNKLGYHVGLRKEDKPLLDRVQAAIHALVASPEMARIRAKWDAYGK